MVRPLCCMPPRTCPSSICCDSDEQELRSSDVYAWCCAAAVCGAAARGIMVAKVPRTLIVLELEGGNDGLNTVIPLEDANYVRLRPGCQQ